MWFSRGRKSWMYAGWAMLVEVSRRGRGGEGEVVVGTGKGLHVRPSSPGATRVLNAD
jgi:hypothetical protein